MAYLEVKRYQTKSGLKWSVKQVEYVPGEGGDKKKSKSLTDTALADLGFSKARTPAEARAHAKKLNALSQIKRKEQRQKVSASENLQDLTVIKNSIVPEEMSELFINHIQEEWYGGKYNLTSSTNLE
jgi:hypothetical protein